MYIYCIVSQVCVTTLASHSFYIFDKFCVTVYKDCWPVCGTILICWFVFCDSQCFKMNIIKKKQHNIHVLSILIWLNTLHSVNTIWSSLNAASILCTDSKAEWTTHWTSRESLPIRCCVDGSFNKNGTLNGHHMLNFSLKSFLMV